jgi:hypothetical protein
LSANAPCPPRPNWTGICLAILGTGKVGLRVRAMAQRIYEAKITPAVGDDPIVVSVPADDSMHARRLIEEQFGPIRHWWSQPTPKANGPG